MAKTINFDEKNNLIISEFSEQIIDGRKTIIGTYRSMDAGQIEKHLSMINTDLNATEKTKAASVIQATKAIK